jgi:hypothetical protein
MIDDRIAMRTWRERIEALVARANALAGSGGGSGVFSFLVINAIDTNAAVTSSSTAVFMSGLTADRTVSLPAAPSTGQEVVVKDADGSLAAHNIVVDGNGKLIDGAATYTLNLVQDGLKGSLTVIYNGTSWGIV